MAKMTQLKVVKSDGSIEEYMHTKVIGSFSNALSAVDEPSIFAAEQFAEVITYYLYERKDSRIVSSDEIHLMMQSVLAATGYEPAALALKEHRLSRSIKRKRIEVINNGNGADGDANMLSQWDKSQIVSNLIEGNINHHVARAIASSVEERVLRMGMTRVPRSLIKQLVAVDKESMLTAEGQLQAVGG
jgi:hypothetical protein